MGRYGETAIEAVREAAATGDPVHAWKRAAMLTFPDSPSSRNKACPKSTFLGLCENGLVKGIKAGRYTRSVENKAYAVKAVELLQHNPALADDPVRLWDLIIGNEGKVENQQMDVVISLCYREAYLYPDAQSPRRDGRLHAPLRSAFRRRSCRSLCGSNMSVTEMAKWRNGLRDCRRDHRCRDDRDRKGHSRPQEVAEKLWKRPMAENEGHGARSPHERTRTACGASLV